MTLMSRKVDYALVILSYLDKNRDGACAREIADRYGLSKGFVANILKLLCAKGFVASHRGVKGGYHLVRDSEEINLAELMETLDDSFNLAECTKLGDGVPCTLSDICPIRGAIHDVHRRIREVLRTVTLAEVFRPSRDNGLQVGLEFLPVLTERVAQ